MSFEIGKPISEKLSAYLRRSLTKTDRAEIAGSLSASPSTIRDLIYREAIVTEKKRPYLEACVRRAVKNCQDNIADSRVAQEYFDMELAMVDQEQKNDD